MRNSGKVIVFAGTTEGSRLARCLAGGLGKAIICVATEYGAQLLEKELDEAKQCESSTLEHDVFKNRTNVEIRWGRLDEEQMVELFERERPSLVIDATHPYAVLVTACIRAACARCQGIRLLRCLREQDGLEAGLTGQEAGSLVYVPTAQAAALWLSQHSGNILLTTGSKELSAFSSIPDYTKRIFVRVLPVEASLRLCLEQGYDGRHIIAMQGPFSEQLNVALLKEYGCCYLVTKDSGRAGGFREKLLAAAGAEAVSVVIERPEDAGKPLSEIMKLVKEWMNHEGAGK